MRGRRTVGPLLRRVGLGLLAGAVVQSAALAQDTTRTRRDSVQLRIPVPSRADSVLRDSLRKRDSLLAARPAVPRDTVKAPVARAELPPSHDALVEYRWTRDSLYATGAITLPDLLVRVPGLTDFRAGYVASPVVAGYLGDLRRVRFFLDAVELPPVDPKAGTVLDLSWIQLWTLEEVRVERGATELRVHMRSWRVDRTTPASRVDVATGDQQTNLFRGYFGRRYAHGEVLQVGGQQFSTTPPRLGASSDQLSLMGRLGIARRGWSADGYVQRTTAHRGVTRRVSDLLRLIEEPDSIPELDATRTDAYLRAAVGDPEAGPWAQALAAAVAHEYTGRVTEVRDTLSDTLGVARDSVRRHTQFVVTGGWTLGLLRLSAANRTMRHRDATFNVPSARAELTLPWVSAGAFVEGKGLDSTARAEVAGRLQPLSFVSVAATVGQLVDDREGGEGGMYARLEGAVRLGGLRIGAGALRRPPALLAAPTIFSVDSLSDSLARRVEPAATGLFAQLRGRLVGPIQLDLLGVRWDSAGYYRPRFQARSEVFVATTLPRRFPSGNFGLRVSVAHDYRSDVLVPHGTGSRRAAGYRTWTGLLEIRIVDAVISYQYRNLFGEIHEQVPGYLMPRQTQFYGVRWTFFN